MCVVLVAKFVEGAWITAIFIPMTIALFIAVRRHYHHIRMLTTCKIPVQVASLNQAPIVVIPVDRWSNITRQGIEFAARLSPEVIAVHVEPTTHSELLREDWERYVDKPFRAASIKRPPKLQNSAFAIPLRDHSRCSVHTRSLRARIPSGNIIVVIPELVEGKWYQYLLHNQRGRLLEWVLFARGNERIFTVSAPWYVGQRVG